MSICTILIIQLKNKSNSTRFWPLSEFWVYFFIFFCYFTNQIVSVKLSRVVASAGQRHRVRRYVGHCQCLVLVVLLLQSDWVRIVMLPQPGQQLDLQLFGAQLSFQTTAGLRHLHGHNRLGGIRPGSPSPVFVPLQGQPVDGALQFCRKHRERGH